MRKKILSLVLCFLILPLSIILSACGKAKPKSVDIVAKTKFEYLEEFSVGDDAYFMLNKTKGDAEKFEIDSIDYDAELKIATAGDFKIDYSKYNPNKLGDYEITVTYTNAKNVTGSYTVTVGTKNYSSDDVKLSVVDVSDKEKEINVSALVYDGKSYAIEVKSSISSAKVTYSTDGETYSETQPTFKNAGTHTVYYTVSSEEYAPDIKDVASFTIQKRNVAVIWSNLEFEYDSSEHIPSCRVNPESLVEGDECNVVVTGAQSITGTHTVVAESLSNSNYKFIIGPISRTFKINKKSVQLPTVTGSFVYDSTTKRPVIEERESDKIYYTKTGTESAINSGSYSVEFELINAENYAWSDGTSEKKTLTWTIAKADFGTLSWNIPANYSFVYDGVEKEIKILSLPAGLEASYTGNKATNAGNYTASAQFTYNETNYNTPVLGSISWNIEKAVIKKTDIVIPTVYIDETTLTDTTILGDIAISDSHFSWFNPSAIVKNIINGRKTSSSDVITYLTIAAEYLPEDTTNYTGPSDLYLEVVITNPEKTTLKAYELGDTADTTKDIAFVSTTVEYDGEPHMISVYLSGENTSEVAKDCTISYFYASDNNYTEDAVSGNKVPAYSATNPAFSLVGKYYIYFKVEGNGFNTFIGVAELVITTEKIKLASDVKVVSINLTTDNKLKDVEVEFDVTNTSEVVYEWKNPEEYLALGQHSYTLIIKSVNQNIDNIEVEVSITATQGAIVKTFQINGEDVTVTLDSGAVNVPMEINDTAVIDFSNIPSGYVVCLLKNKETELEYLQNNSYTINCKDEFYLKNYVFVVLPENDKTIDAEVQRIEISPSKPRYIKKLEIVTSNNSGNTTSEVDVNNSNIVVSNKLEEIRVQVEDDYTFEIYIDGTKYVSGFDGYKFNADGTNLTIVIFNKAGSIVRYNEYKLVFDMKSRVGANKLAYTTKYGGRLEEYKFNINDWAVLVLANDNVNLYVYEEGLNSWLSSSAGQFSVVNDLTVYKAELAEGSYVIYQKFAVVGIKSTEKDYDTVYDGNLDEYYLEGAGNYFSFDSNTIFVNGTLNLDGLKLFCTDTDDAITAVIKRVDNYLMVVFTITKDGATVTYKKVFKVEENNLVDGNTRYVFGIMTNANITEMLDGDIELKDITSNVIELDGVKDAILIRLVNPSASVSFENKKFQFERYEDFVVISATESMSDEVFKFKIVASNGEKLEITLIISATFA